MSVHEVYPPGRKVLTEAKTRAEGGGIAGGWTFSLFSFWEYFPRRTGKKRLQEDIHEYDWSFERTISDLFAVLNYQLKEKMYFMVNFTPKWTCFILLGHRCRESSTCDQSQQGRQDFTWSIVAAGDQQDERNEKSHKKPDSPHGWEEGKSQGTHVLPRILTPVLTSMLMATSSCSFLLS